MSDTALDRELETVLRVEPSPEFLARLRTRVASEPAPTLWGGRWLLPAATAVAGIAFVFAMWLPRGSADISRPTPSETASSATAPAVLSADANRDRSVERQATGAPGAAPHAVGRAVAAASAMASGRSERPLAPASMAAERPFPEVVISVEEQHAFALLLRSIDQRRLPPVREDVLAAGRALEAMPLEIRPLVIEPLATADRVE